MKAYTIFDDYTEEARNILLEAGVEITVHPMGVPRPDHDQMKVILESYDCVIIGTSQKLTEDTFENITTPRIIATASVGIDHIRVPEEKKNLITIINTPKANAQSVAEYTIGCALSCIKRLDEGNKLYRAGKNNKSLYRKPEDLAGKTIGVIGAGNISAKIMEYAQFFGMNVLCWTRNPNAHNDLAEKGIRFVSLNELVVSADVISFNLPNSNETKRFITSELVAAMKPTAVFISVSRLETVDYNALLNKANNNPGFYVCLDVDINENVVNGIGNQSNILITPHIAGGTIETRKRMFQEISKEIVSIFHE